MRYFRDVKRIHPYSLMDKKLLSVRVVTYLSVKSTLGSAVADNSITVTYSYMEKLGIDPSTSRMLSERSTI